MASHGAQAGRGKLAAATSDPVAAVRRRFPGREQQVDLLAEEVLLSDDRLGAGCLVYGPESTGKTAIVRALLHALRLRFAYVNCTEARPARLLLGEILHQLKGGKRQRDDEWECGVKCDSLADFRLQLPGVVGRSRQRSASGSSGPCCWLVLDHADRLAASDLLAGLMRAREDTGADVAVLMLGHVGWGSGRYLRDTNAALPPKEVHFGAYKPEQLQQILELRRQRLGGATAAADAPAFRQFLTSFVGSFCRASNNLLDLQAAVEELFPLYMRPLREGQQLQSHKLYNLIKPQVQELIQALQLQLDHSGGEDDSGSGMQQQGAAAAAAAGAGSWQDAQQQWEAGTKGKTRRANSAGLQFELPFISKYLLLAAYIASRNKPTSDRAVFDPGYKKRGRKDAQAHDRQVEAALEAKLRGPHAFPLERLLHIFFAIYGHHDADEDHQDEEEDGQNQKEAWHVMQQAEVLQQVSSLVTLSLLEHGSGDVLEGQLYRCNMDDGMAEKLAENVGLRLTDYLRMG